MATRLVAMRRTAARMALTAGALALALSPTVRAQRSAYRASPPQVVVQVSADVSGAVSINAWSRDGAVDLGPALAEALNCRGRAMPEPGRPTALSCPTGLRRRGFALEGTVDLAPLSRQLNGSAAIVLWLSYPRLGFQSASMPAVAPGEGEDTEPDSGEEADSRMNRTMTFAAGVVPAPIQIRFGFRADQLAGIYLPLLALALALTAISVLLARAGYAGLGRSAVVLGTIVWMGLAAQLQADAPARILLWGSPLANLAALLIDLWPPLVCVALGIACGSGMRPGPAQPARFGQVFGGFAVIALLMTSVVGSLPSLTRADWPVAAMWLAATPAILLARRFWAKAGARSRLTQLAAGELNDRISALAARAGCPRVKVNILTPRTDVAAAFALPGRSIYLTASLIRSLSKREVDAIVGHELSHYRHNNRGLWTALCISMVLFETPAREILSQWAAGPLVALFVPVAIVLATLHGMRRREFLADAGATALTADPRAMISSLAKVCRSNRVPLPMNRALEWFSTHPSTARRIRALAAASRLDEAELESLCATGDPGPSYEIAAPPSSGSIFSPAWQHSNVRLYGWTVIFASCGAGVSLAWLLERFTGLGAFQVLAAIALGCLLTKGAAATAMAANYARLRRKLQARLGVRGELVGLALDSQPRVYKGYRFSDAGLVCFEGGRLCYRSERITISLNAADVIDVGRAAASPSAFVRWQPMVRFRRPDSSEPGAIILHPVRWLPAQWGLLRSIKRWSAEHSPAENTSLSGFTPVEGQPFQRPTLVTAASTFRVTGAMTLVAALAVLWLLHAEWWYPLCALAIAACAQTFMQVPSMLYRVPQPPAAELATSAQL